MSIAPVTAGPPIGANRPSSNVSAPPAQPATESTGVANTQAAAAASGSARTTSTEVERDPSGLVVVRTLDAATHQIVAQMPTEAYLRLAQAMTETVRSEVRQDAVTGTIA